MCLIICFDKTNHGSFYYMLHYLIKHSSIQNEYTKYALEIYKNEEKYFKIENNELIHELSTTLPRMSSSKEEIAWEESFTQVMPWIHLTD